MREDALSLIKAEYNALTQMERGIADYVLAHSEQVLYMSITQLSEACSVADSSIYRFCQHVMRCGYLEFRSRLMFSANAEEARNGYEEAAIEDTVLGQRLHELYLCNLSVLRQTYRSLNIDELEEATARMRKASRIMFMGMGTSLVSVMDAFQHFLRVTPKVCCSIETHTQELLASSLTKSDVAIVFSRSGSTPETLALAKSVKNNGVYLIGITHCAQSPLYRLSDLGFLCGRGEELCSQDDAKQPFKRCMSASFASRAFLMDALCTVYTAEANSREPS
ncbi:MAG: MurR/RpiR family transcriptional regulator [Clostridia bacterium]